jgi:hypothetical protein
MWRFLHGRGKQMSTRCSTEKRKDFTTALVLRREVFRMVVHGPYTAPLDRVHIGRSPICRDGNFSRRIRSPGYPLVTRRLAPALV